MKENHCERKCGTRSNFGKGSLLMKTVFSNYLSISNFKPAIITVIMLLTVLSLPIFGQETTQELIGTKKNLPKLLDLGAKKCIPCKKMAPILDKMEKEYKGVLDVEFVDVWESKNKKRAQKHKVRSIPTQIFFDKNGKELWRHIGFISEKDMLKKWKELGYDFKPVVGKKKPGQI